jgi:nucleoside 2-deoxyribosyltransferase
MKIYIGGRISGLSYEEASEYFNTTKEVLESIGYYVYSPMTAKNSLRTEINLRSSGYGNPTSTNHAIFERDKWSVHQADVFYLNLEKAVDFVSIGGMMELAWAAELGKHVVVVMQAENIHRHAFVLESADIIFTTHAEAISYLDKLIHQKG